MHQLKTPVCLTIFNRYDTTHKVFEAIRQVQPPILLVIADGPRVDNPGEAEKCAKVRAIIDRVDWKCKVLKNFSDVNLGLKKRVSTGLDWVFNTVEEAIILEDDCLPHPTFFRFCEDLLSHYRHDERVMLITGTNFQFGLKRTDYSYYFSRYIDCWGWATWKRAWQHYDFDMKQWPEIRDNNWLLDILQDPQEADGWENIFEKTYNGYINSWAYRWKLACWIQSGLTIIPNTNLVSNIGFNADAIHTKDSKSPFANTPVEAMNFPLHHPEFVIRDTQADEFTKRVMFGGDIGELRRRITYWWLNLHEEDFRNEYNQKQIINFFKSSVIDEHHKIEDSVNQKELINKMLLKYDESKKIQYLLVSMLYCYPHQLPVNYDLSSIPDWLFNDYLKFSFDYPSLFQPTGEVNKYSNYLELWVNHLHTIISNNPSSELSQKIAILFTNHVSYVPFCLNAVSIKDLCIKMSNIMNFALSIQGYATDYDFPQRMPGRNKIRLGILSENFGLRPETFSSLPIYQFLNRDLFEIVLYSLWCSGDRLERYCSGHADAGIQLPENLEEQVKTIRDDDLDILLIAEDFTIKKNQIRLIALHRLARIQIAGINSLVTSGIPNIDYYISGKFRELEQDPTQNYTEELVTLDGAGLCWDFATEELGISTINISRKNLGIAEKDIVYFCASGADTILPEVGETWAKIIASVPNSKLLLYPFNLKWSNSYYFPAFIRNLAEIFSQYNLSQEQIIVVNPVQNHADLKAYYKLADIYLDAYPCSDTTALVRSLKIGLPTVVLTGNLSRSRVSSSVLQEIKMFDLIADTEENYIHIAVSLGTKPELYQKHKNQINEQIKMTTNILDSHSYSAQMGVLLKNLFFQKMGENLTENLRLRKTNFIIFPKWEQVDESLYEDLLKIIRNLAIHPENQQITLLIETSNTNVEDTEILLADLSFNLMMQENLDINEGIEISLIVNLNELEWQALLPRIYARIVLTNEDEQALAQLSINELKSLSIDSLSNQVSAD